MWHSATERANTYAAVFSTEGGAKVLEDLKKLAFYDRTTYHDNPYAMAHREGSRGLVLAIEQAIAGAGPVPADPEPAEDFSSDE